MADPFYYSQSIHKPIEFTKQENIPHKSYIPTKASQAFIKTEKIPLKTTLIWKGNEENTKIHTVTHENGGDKSEKERDKLTLQIKAKNKKK